MNTLVKHLRQLSQKAMTVGRYLHGDLPRAHGAVRYGNMAGRGSSGSRGLGRQPGPAEWSVEPRDPLETSILGGDRDEYIDKSFWHEAEAAGVTFDESRVDGVWDEMGDEMWK